MILSSNNIIKGKEASMIDIGLCIGVSPKGAEEASAPPGGIDEC